MTEDRFDGFLRAFEEVIEAPANSVSGEELLSELGSWDSVAVIAFIAMADSRYGASLSPKDISRCQTVRDLASLLPPSPAAG